MSQKAGSEAYNDSAFLYLLFTAQFFILLFGSISYVRTLLSSTRRKETPLKSLVIKGVLLGFLAFWFYQVFTLVQEDANKTSLEGGFDPYEILELPQGTKFNSAEVKKSYRRLAVIYHPDKVSSENQEEASLKFQQIVKAYETLTDNTKYSNWQKYGDPEGSKAFKAIEIALPSFLLKPENQGMVLTVFFIGFICAPIIWVIKK